MRLFVFSESPIVEPGAAFSVHGLLKLSVPATTGRSLLEARSGTEVVSLPDAFGLATGTPLNGPVVLRREARLGPLRAGDWRLSWSVGEHRSPEARLSVREHSGAAGPAGLALVPIGGRASVPGEPQILARFVNAGAETLDLAEALERSALEIDGQVHPHRPFTWDGAFELPPGGSSHQLLALEDYGAEGVRGGSHRVRLRYAGRWSEPVELDLDLD